MFSRATKLIVRSLGPRHFYIGEQNFKNAFTGGAGEISRTLSQMLRSSKKLNVVALYNLAAVNKLSNHNRIHDYCSNQSIGLTPSKVDGSSILHFYKHEADNGKHETEKLTEALYNLPIAEGAPTLNSSLMSNAAMPKAGNARSGMHPHAKLLDEVGPNDTRTHQRDRATNAIRQWLPSLTCSSFQEYVNFFTAARTSRKRPPIKGKIENPSRDTLYAKGTNYRALSSLSFNDKSRGRLTGRSDRTGIFFHAETLGGTKIWTNRPTLALLNNKPRRSREIDGHGFRKRPAIDDPEIGAKIYGIKRENRTRRTLLAADPGSSNLNTQIRSSSWTISDRCGRANIANETLAVSDVLPGRTIPGASKDRGRMFSIRRKLERIRALWERFRGRKERLGDICKKREKSCKRTKGACEEKGDVCHRRTTTDCFEGREQPCGRHAKVLCSGRKISRGDQDGQDCSETRTKKRRKQSCAQDKSNASCTEDPHEKSRRAEPVSGKRRDSGAASCKETKQDDCGRSASKDASREQTKVQKVCQEERVSSKEKKEASCSDTKEAELSKKKECPPLKRAPGCPEDGKEKEDC